MYNKNEMQKFKSKLYQEEKLQRKNSEEKTSKKTFGVKL